MAIAPVRRIYRGRENRIVAGVADGIADYLAVDPAFVRLAFAALSFAGGAGIAIYGLCWVLVPQIPEGETRSPVGSAGRSRAPSAQVALAVGLVVLGLLLLFRASGFWVGDNLVWPALLAAAGVALVWQRSSAQERASLRAFLRGLGGQPRSARLMVVRVAAGVGLFATGVFIFLATSSAGDAARKGLLAIVVVLAGLALTFAPLWRRLARELAEEGRERIRSQERAELAAHLHDSVLQTLSLIQRADDPGAMVGLARRQERELRARLYRGGAPLQAGTVASALELARAEVEDAYGVPIEAVCVGDCQLDEPLEALVKAAREAMTNAARLSGAGRVSLYLEIEEDRVTVFVRDRGSGFDAQAIADDRKGIAESIIGRMQRHGGTAEIRASVGEGTEVELSMPRRADASDVPGAHERSTA
jgi:signal transduction histidine kinase/phage shock protein PspC (stress-responsive transcriptional regulator)